MRKNTLRLVLGVFLATEASLVAIFAAGVLISAISGQVEHLPTAIAVTVLSFVAALAVAATTIGTFMGKSWARGAAVTIQILTLAIGFGTVQGVTAQPLLGLVIIAWAATALVLAIKVQPIEN